jgi:hypothetical protein
MMSASPPDFTEFLPSAGPPLPDLQELHSQMAKVESKRPSYFLSRKVGYFVPLGSLILDFGHFEEAGGQELPYDR